jgi:alpha-L-fucosidase
MKQALSPTILLLACCALAGCAASTRSPTGSSEGSAIVPETQQAHADRMAWWRDARFGMFIHWGVYSVPAGTYNGKTTGGPSEWLMQSLKVPTTDYVKFADGFTTDKYEPADWARLAKQAGMKYVVITSRHHDGFCLWDSAVSEWDVKASAAKHDLLAPLAKAVRDEGLHFGLYYSILDWRHPDYEPKRAWNTRSEWNGGPGYKPDFNGRFVPYVHAQVAEIIKGYDPSVLWFDGEWEETWTTPLGRDLYNHVRSLKPSIIVNNRVGKSRDDMAGLTKPGEQPLGDFCTPEQEVPATGLPGVDWETCMTMNDSWGFKANDHHFKSADQIVRTLCDIASKGGNFLLNIGPKPDGTIPQESIDRLQEVGRWMALNGDAIYGTTASPFKNLSFGRATHRGATLNLMVFDWPKDGQLQLDGLKNGVKSVRVLSLDKMMRMPKVESNADGVRLTDLGPRPGGLGDLPTVVRIELDGEPNVVTPPPPAIGRDQLGNYTLTAGAAQTAGARVKLQGQGATENLGYWTSATDKATWTVANLPAGTYLAEVELACQASDAGCDFEVVVGDAVKRATVPSTDSWDKYTTVTLTDLRVNGGRAVHVEVRAAPGTQLKGGLMNLRQVRLVRTN